MEPLTLVLASQGLQVEDAVAALRLHLPRTQAAIKRQIEEGVRKGQLERSHGELFQLYLDSVLGSSLVVLKAEMSMHRHSAGTALNASLKQAVIKAKGRVLAAIRLEAMEIRYMRERRNLACRQIWKQCSALKAKVLQETLKSMKTAKQPTWKQGFRTAEMAIRRSKTVKELLAFRRWKLNMRSQSKPLCKALERMWRNRSLPLFASLKNQHGLREKRQEKLQILLRNKLTAVCFSMQLKLQKWRINSYSRRNLIKRLMALAVFKPKEVLKTWRLAAARSTENANQKRAFKLSFALQKVIRSHMQTEPVHPANPQLLRARLDSAIRRSLMCAFRHVVESSKLRNHMRNLAISALHRPREAFSRWQRQIHALRFSEKLIPPKGHNIRSLLQPLTVLRTKHFLQAILQADSTRKVLRTLVIFCQSSLRNILAKWHLASAKQKTGKIQQQLQGWKASMHLNKAARPALHSAFNRRPASHSLSLQQALTRLTAKILKKSWDGITGRNVPRVKSVLLRMAARPKSALLTWKRTILPKRSILKGVIFRDTLLRTAERTMRSVALRLARPRGTVIRSFQGLMKRWDGRVRESLRKWNNKVNETKGNDAQKQKDCLEINRGVRLSAVLGRLSKKSFHFCLHMVTGHSVKAGCRRLNSLAHKITRKAVNKWQKVIQFTHKNEMEGGLSALKLRQKLETTQRRLLRSALLRVITGRLIDFTGLFRVLQRHACEPKLALTKWKHYTKGRVKGDLSLLLKGQILRKSLSSVVLRPLRSAGHYLLGSWWTVVWSRLAMRPMCAFNHWRALTPHKADISPASFQLVPKPAGRIILAEEDQGARKLNKALHNLPRRLVRTVFAQLVTGERHAKVRVAEVLRIMKSSTNEAFQRWKTSTQQQAKIQLMGEVKGHQLRTAMALIPTLTCNFAFHVLVDQPNRLKAALRALMRSGKDSQQAALRTWQRYTASVKAGKLLSAATIHRIQYLLDRVPARLVNGVFKTVTAKPQKTKAALRAFANGLLLRPKRYILAWKDASQGTRLVALRREVLRRTLSHSAIRTIRSVLSLLTTKPVLGLQTVRNRALARVISRKPNLAFFMWKLLIQQTKKNNERVYMQKTKMRKILTLYLIKILRESLKLIIRNRKAGVRKVARLPTERLKTALSLWRSIIPASNKGKRFADGLWLLILRRARQTFNCLKAPDALKRVFRGLGVISSRGQFAAFSRWKRQTPRKLASALKLQNRLIRTVTFRLRKTLQSLSYPIRVRKALRTINITATKRKYRCFQLWQKFVHSKPPLGLIFRQLMQQMPRKILRSCWNKIFVESHTLMYLRVFSRIAKGNLSAGYMRWRALVREHTRRTQSRRATVFALKLKSASSRRLGSALASVTVQSKSTWILLQNVLKWRGQAPEVRIKALQSMVLRAASRSLLSVLRRISRERRSVSRTPSRQRHRNNQETRYVFLRMGAALRQKLRTAFISLNNRREKCVLVRKVQAAEKTARMLIKSQRMSEGRCFQVWKSDLHLCKLQEKSLLRLVFAVSASYQSAFWKWKLLVRRRHKPSPAALLQRLRTHMNQQELRAAERAGALEVVGLLVKGLRVRQLAKAMGRIQARAMVKQV